MTNALGLTEFQKHVYDFVKDTIENEKYEVCLDADYSSSIAGYIDGYVVIGGTRFKCSFNKANYICWHVDAFIEYVLKLMTDKETKHICKTAFGIAKSDVAKNKKLIDDYKKRLQSLEECVNYNSED